jgi:hypothetical protein
MAMDTLSIAEAKNRFTEIADRVAPSTITSP